MGCLWSRPSSSQSSESNMAASSARGLTGLVRLFHGSCARSASSAAAVKVEPRFMASRCRAGRNKRREVKPSPKKLAIASNVRDVFENNSMVAVFQYGDMNTAEWDDLRHKLGKNDVKVKIFPNRVTHKALEETVYREISPLFLCTTCIIYSQQNTVKHILDAVKKLPKLELLGAKIDNRLLSRSNVQEFAKLPSLSELHVNLVQLLQQQTCQLSSLLQQNQTQMSINLTQLVAQGE